MENATLTELLRVFAGFLLGLVFYFGLWWTVSRGLKQPTKTTVLLFPLSQFVRTAVVLIGFYWISKGDWKRLLPCFLGFLIGRLTVTHFTRVKRTKHAS